MITVGDAVLEQARIRQLLDAGVEGPSVLAWHYESPALVLGRGQKPSADLLLRAAREHLAVVGRGSGGGAVLAGPWLLSLTLLLPAAHPLARMSLPSSYRAAGEGCRRVLQRFQVSTELATDAESSSARRGGDGDDLAWACFAGLSHGELVAERRRKVVGLSQVRRRDAIAICIGVLLHRPDWASLVRVWLGREDPQLVQRLGDRTASCDQLTPAGLVPTADTLSASFEAELLPRQMAA